mmetsp:Transcript_9650/g.11593  ORF Transcript_9650/g.11593 Transcript_9650/m.11593 type:complete len:90 (+) Transcript_9650:1149-1418(+)
MKWVHLSSQLERIPSIKTESSGVARNKSTLPWKKEGQFFQQEPSQNFAESWFHSCQKGVKLVQYSRNARNSLLPGTQTNYFPRYHAKLS